MTIIMYHYILLSLKKEENSDRCYKMDDSQGHYAKWNKPDKYKYCMISLIEGI